MYIFVTEIPLQRVTIVIKDDLFICNNSLCLWKCERCKYAKEAIEKINKKEKEHGENRTDS